MKRPFALMVALAAIFCAYKPARADERTPVVESQLPNGLHVLVEEDHRLPTVSVTIRYGVGSAMDPPGRQGLTDLVMHLMARRTLHVPEPDAFSAHIDAVGGSWAFRTTAEAVEFQATVSSNRAALLAWLYSDQLGFFTQSLDKTAIDKRLQMIRIQRGQSADAVLAFANELVTEELYPAGHPYRRSSSEDAVDDLQSLTVAEVRDYFLKWFLPENTTISFSGDITTSNAQALVTQYFGPILPGDVPHPPTVKETQLRGEVLLEMEANVEHPIATITWPTPAQYSAGDADLDLLTEIFDGHRTGYLTWALIDRQKIASTVFAHQTSRRLGSTYTIRATASAGHTAQELANAIDTVISQIQTSGVTDDERDGAVAYTLMPAMLGLASQPQRALLRARWFMIAGDTNFYTRDRERYEHATRESMRDAAVRYLPRDRRIVTLVTPASSAPVRGRLVVRRATPAAAPAPAQGGRP